MNIYPNFSNRKFDSRQFFMDFSIISITWSSPGHQRWSGHWLVGQPVKFSLWFF